VVPDDLFIIRRLSPWCNESALSAESFAFAMTKKLEHLFNASAQGLGTSLPTLGGSAGALGSRFMTLSVSDRPTTLTASSLFLTSFAI
jgi:hypothetical protein